MSWAPGRSQPPERQHSQMLASLTGGVRPQLMIFVAGANLHSIIRDDIHLSAGAHIGVMVIPAALALAQRENWSGKTLLKSIVGGYEMAAALGSAVRSSGTCNPHFRPSGIIGAFAAAAAGVVADANISSDAAASALSLAANMAAGLNEWPWAGGMEINTQMGTASRSGITSLDLARAGIRSSETILEGKDGLFVAYGCGPDSSKHFQEWMSASSLGAGIMGAKFKPTAGCNFIQTPLSAALGLSAKISPAVEDVERIVIITTTAAQAYPGCDNLGPFSQVQQTKMSLQYGVSAALLFGRVDEPVFRQFENEALGMLIRKCHIEPSAAYDEALSNGKQPCRIEVIMRDGSRHENSLADVPWLEGDAVEQRFRQEAAATFDFETVSRIVSECQQLQGSTTCASLFSLLRS